MMWTYQKQDSLAGTFLEMTEVVGKICLVGIPGKIYLGIHEKIWFVENPGMLSHLMGSGTFLDKPYHAMFPGLFPTHVVFLVQSKMIPPKVRGMLSLDIYCLDRLGLVKTSFAKICRVFVDRG